MTLLFDHISFYTYYKKRKSICEKYRDLKQQLVDGGLDSRQYMGSLRKLHYSAIELELDYFDIRYLRL